MTKFEKDQQDWREREERLKNAMEKVIEIIDEALEGVSEEERYRRKELLGRDCEQMTMLQVLCHTDRVN